MSSTAQGGPPAGAGGGASQGPPDTTDGASPPALPPNASDNMQPTIIGVCAFLMAWSTIMITARIYTRKFVIDLMGWDDYAAILGWLFTMGTAIIVMHNTNYNLGRHVYLILPDQVPLYFRDFYLSMVFYCAGLLFLKLTFLFQYYRVLAVNRMRTVYIIAIIIVGGWGLSQTLVGIFSCVPIHAFWDKTVPNARCIPNIPQWYINAAGNIATDVAVFALPLPAIWKLNLVQGQKIILVGIFSLGFFTVIISVIRIRYLYMFEDFTWESSPSALWSVGELVSALTCACLPTLRPFVVKFFPGLIAVLGRSTAAARDPSHKPSKSGGGSSGGDLGGKWAGSKLGNRSGDKSGVMSLHSRTDLENEDKGGSEVELSARDGATTPKSPFDASFEAADLRRERRFRRGSVDSGSSAGSTMGRNNGVPKGPRENRVGVRTSIRPERRRAETDSEGQGVQVHMEVTQVRN